MTTEDMSKIDTSELARQLGKLFGTKDLSPKKKRRKGKGKGKKRCEHCSQLLRIDRHHIVYEPEVIALLCRKCHLKITEWNTKAARMLGHKLSNVERTKIWIRFMKNTGAKV